jgi:hypothetical protein
MSKTPTQKAPVNYIHPEEIKAFVTRFAGDISIESVRKRFIKLATDVLRADPSHARPLRSSDFQNAPTWLGEALAEGREVMAFAPMMRVRRSLRLKALAVAGACSEVAYLATAPSDALTEQDIANTQFAREFVRKARRMNFESLVKRAKQLWRAQCQRQEQHDAKIVHFTPEEIFAAPGRVWRRICSTGELGALGRKMRNCLADYTHYHGRYAKWLREDIARFWQLQDHAGVTLMVVMVDTASLRVIEARRFRNAAVDPDDPDLKVLVHARGLKIDTMEARLRRIGDLTEIQRPALRGPELLRENLRQVYEAVAEPVPDRFARLLDEIAPEQRPRRRI